MSNSKIKIAFYQFNPTVGDLVSNTEKILTCCSLARKAGADLFILPELALCGYPPEDLLLRPEFHQQVQRQIDQMLMFSGITILLPCPILENGLCYNSVLVIRDGLILGRADKQNLPNYGVFDEKRYFTSGTNGANNCLVFKCKDTMVGVLICEDMWVESPALTLAKAGAEVICVVNASPYEATKYQERLSIAKSRVTETKLPLLYVNMVGGQDELVFDGATFALNNVLADNGNGVLEPKIVMQTNAFEESLEYVDFDKTTKEFNQHNELTPRNVKYPKLEECIYKALQYGVHDYVIKNNFKGVVLGLSGGVDSALTLAIAVDALGVNNVMCLMMPSKYTTEISIACARDMVQRLGVRYEEIPIMPVFERFNEQLAPIFAGRTADITEENLQARVRGTLLMAVANKFGYLVLTTGNKSEIAMGYATLYGDMAGGFAVLKDVLKTTVYKLCHYRNGLSVIAADGLTNIIPESIISRAPTAELKDNQTDQDTLPPYDILDQVVPLLVEDRLSSNEIIAMGFDPHHVEKIATLLEFNEYKRRQAPVGPKVSRVAFARDWRYPITNRFKF
jgi:NAD+ synthase (glutamine-hydrolysing)